MTRTLLLNIRPGEVRGVLVVHGRPLEYRIERAASGSRIGDVMLGRIVRLLPALPGCLVDIGLERPALLEGRLADLHEGQAVVVQVRRDPQGEKAANVTRNVVLQERLLRWTPYRAGVDTGQLAADARAAVAERLGRSVAPNEGVAANVAAADAPEEHLASAVARLRARWRAILDRAAEARPPVPLAVEASPASRLLSELLHFSPASIVIDEPGAFAVARHWLAVHGPSPAPDLCLYTDPLPLFDAFGIADDLASVTARRIALPDGGSIVIDTTAAATLIDVNAAGAASGRDAPASMILAVNLAAATEIVRQIRLRGIAGAIVVDFISMRRREHRERVAGRIAEALSADPGECRILGWTRLGHLEMTRRRRHTPLTELLCDLPTEERMTAETIALEALDSVWREMRCRPGAGTAALTVASEIAAALDGSAAPGRRELEAWLHRPVSVTSESSRRRDDVDIRIE